MSKKQSEQMNTTFAANHQNVSEDEAAALIVVASQEIKKISDLKKNDEKLKAAKQIIKDFSKAYDSAISHERSKIKFLLEQIEKIQGNQVNPTSGLSN